MSMLPKQNNLAACPFCGGQADLEGNYTADGAVRIVAKCQECGATAGSVTYHDSFDNIELYLGALWYVVETWNKRAEPQGDQTEVFL